MAQNSIQSVDRALGLLWLVRDNPGITLTEASSRTGLLPSTALRLLGTLEHHDLVERAPESKGYRIGAAAATLTAALARRTVVDLTHTLEPLVRDLSVRCREQVSLGILDEGAVIHLVIVDGAANAGADVLVRHPGRRAHPNLYATAQGKVFLAHAPEAEAESLIARQSFERTASRTITDPDTLREHLGTGRRRGYALSVNENTDHVRGAAAPVFDGTGTVVAALAVHGPTIRLPRARLTTLVSAVRDAAQECSRLLGHRPSDDLDTGRR